MPDRTTTERQARPGQPQADLSIKVVLLIILALYMLLFGVLLFGIGGGALPYSPDSAYGVFLVVIALQAITMGKTPFGDLRRTRAVMLGGIVAAAFGMLACFIPGLVSGGARLLTGVVATGGGATLAVRLLSRKEATQWLGTPGLPRRAVLAAVAVYALLVPLGLVTLLPGIFTDQVTAVLLVVCGAAIGVLARLMHDVANTYPAEAAGKPRRTREGTEPRPWLFQESTLPLNLVTLIVTGTLLVLLALMLVPVGLGLLPFSPNGQLGVLMIVNAVQIMALGETPVGQYRRSWPLVGGGVAFAALGTVACIIPGLLTDWLRLLLGTLTATGGALGLIRTIRSLARRAPDSPEPSPQNAAVLRGLVVLQLLVNALGTIFGCSMLLPGIVPTLGIVVILALNGTAVFLLATTLLRLTRAAS